MFLGFLYTEIGSGQLNDPEFMLQARAVRLQGKRILFLPGAQRCSQVTLSQNVVDPTSSCLAATHPEKPP
jgi:hypothetical protein